MEQRQIAYMHMHLDAMDQLKNSKQASLALVWECLLLNHNFDS